MKLKKANNWITLVANIGIVAGLVFLAYETHQNTVQLRAEASYSINEALSVLNSGLYNDPVLSDIVVRGEQSLASLNPTERKQFVAFQFDRLNLGIHVMALEKDGLFEVHFPYIDFLEQEYRRNPGLQEFLILIEDSWAGPQELYEKLRLKTDAPPAGGASTPDPL